MRSARTIWKCPQPRTGCGARSTRLKEGATKMYQTIYHRASSVDEAASLFAKGSEAKFLAGGQTLLPVMKQRLASPSDVIDLAKIKDLIGVEPTGAGILIKAATTHYDVANSDTVKNAIPALAYLASVI